VYLSFDFTGLRVHIINEMNDKSSYQGEKSTLGKTAFQIIILAIMGLLIFLTSITFRAQDVSDLEGYKTGGSGKAPNLLALLTASVEKERPCEIKEEELNRYLSERVSIKQEGFLKDKLKMKVKGFGVRVEPGQMEIIVEREVMGYPHTVSMFLETQTQNNSQGQPVLVLERTGARLGQQKFPPVYALLVQDGFKAIQKVLKKELELGFGGMTSIRFEEGLIKLDPRPIELTPDNPGNL